MKRRAIGINGHIQQLARVYKNIKIGYNYTDKYD
jgi:hypothetical protein